MKKAFAIMLAMFLTFSTVLPVSATDTPSSQKIVYVASRNVPESATKFARDWFSNNMPAQDLCNLTKLTLKQAKKVSVCPGFIAETFEVDTNIYGDIYFFPLLYGDTFVGMLIVSGSKDSGYGCMPDRRDDLTDPLNTLPSGAKAPLMFIESPNSSFVMDSKNNVTCLETFDLFYPIDAEEQRQAITKMKKPSTVVAISADTAHPEQVSPHKYDGGTPVLTVKNETKKLTYSSDDLGKTWKNNAKPPVCISIIGDIVLQKKDAKVPYTVYNYTQKRIKTDVNFSLRKWNGQKWVKVPELDDLTFSNKAVIISPNSSCATSAAWGRLSGINLEDGQYKLVKKISIDNQQYTCEVEFFLE